MNEHDCAELVSGRRSDKRGWSRNSVSSPGTEAPGATAGSSEPESESPAMAKTPDLAPPSAPRVSNLTMVPIAPAPPAVPSHPVAAPDPQFHPLSGLPQTVPAPATRSVWRIYCFGRQGLPNPM